MRLVLTAAHKLAAPALFAVWVSLAESSSWCALRNAWGVARCTSALHARNEACATVMPLKLDSIVSLQAASMASTVWMLHHHFHACRCCCHCITGSCCILTSHYYLPLKERKKETSWLVCMLLYLLLIIQGIVTFFGVGLISCDPFHLVMPPLRSTMLLLLLLPLPLPHLPALWRSAAAAVGRRRHISHNLNTSTAAQDSSSSSSSSHCSTADATTGSSSSSSWVYWYHPSLWWLQPAIRHAMIAAQRLVPPVAAALAAGAPHSSLYFAYSNLGKYIYQGWLQYMLVVSGNAQGSW
jgi:hypothetical protein